MRIDPKTSIIGPYRCLIYPKKSGFGMNLWRQRSIWTNESNKEIDQNTAMKQGKRDLHLQGIIASIL